MLDYVTVPHIQESSNGKIYSIKQYKNRVKRAVQYAVFSSLTDNFHTKRPPNLWYPSDMKKFELIDKAEKTIDNFEIEKDEDLKGELFYFFLNELSEHYQIGESKKSEDTANFLVKEIEMALHSIQ